MMNRPTLSTRTLAAGVATSAVAASAVFMSIGIAVADTHNNEVERPSSFTSAFTASATPDQIFDADGNSVDGQPDASGEYTFFINSDEDIICFEISLRGVTPPYESPAHTGTHIHQAEAGVQGPPRIAFPDPQGAFNATSSGCIQGPFTTGVQNDDGDDHGDGFTLAQIEADPAQFYADTHTSEYPGGAVRGQLVAIPVGGVDAGFGGEQAAASSSSRAPLVAALLAGAVAFAVFIGIGSRRRSSE